MIITGRHRVSRGVVSALTQPAIRVQDLVTEATIAVADISRGAHRSECLSVLSDESK